MLVSVSSTIQSSVQSLGGYDVTRVGTVTLLE
jgi:hypothetical protein